VECRDGVRSHRFPGRSQPKALSLPFEPENTVTYTFGIGWRVRELRLETRLYCTAVLSALDAPPWIFNMPKRCGIIKLNMVTVFMFL
jgi:hypothetical protein